MNVRVTPRGFPHRTDLYTGVVRILSDGAWWTFTNRRTPYPPLAFTEVAELTVDDEAGDFEYGDAE